MTDNPFLFSSHSSPSNQISPSNKTFKQAQKPIYFIALSILAVIFTATGVWAQNVPPGEDVGAQSQRLTEQAQAVENTFEEKKVEKPVESPQENQALEGVETVSFVLKGIEIQGLKAYSPAEMEPVYAGYLNKPVTMADIDQIIEAVKQKYKKGGYLTTTAYLPPQDVKDGIIKINVVEGKLGALKVEGNQHFSDAMIFSYIHQKPNQILNMNELMKDVLRLNKKSDLKVKAVLSPGTAPETVDVTLKVQDNSTWHRGVTMDNLGSRLLGKVRGGAYIRGTNVSGVGDSLFINTSMNSRLLGETFSYRRPFGSQGTSLGLTFSHFDFKLGEEFKVFDITGSSNQGSFDISKELYLSESFESTLSGGLIVKSIKRHVLGSLTSNDQLRIPYIALEFIENDSMGSTRLSPKWEFGTANFLGASSRNHPSASRSGTGGAYVKYNQELSRSFKLPFESLLRLSGEFQMASRTLPSSEQFQIGGEGSVRGYPQGEYLADNGWISSLEISTPMYFIPKTWVLPKEKTPLRYQVQPYGFVDMGSGKIKRVLTGERDNRTLWSMGGGVRVQLYHSLFFNIDWAKAMGNKPSPGSGPSTFHFALQMEM